MNRNELLTRDYKFEVKNLDHDSGEFSGLASGTNTTDLTGDVIERGAFGRTIEHWRKSGRNVPVLWQHDSAKPIGFMDPNKMKETRSGLQIVGKLIMTIPEAQTARELLKAKAITGMSIGFTIPKNKVTFDEKRRVRRIHEVQLWENSIVTFPANPKAHITEIKSHCAACSEALADGLSGDGDALKQEHSPAGSLDRLRRASYDIDSGETAHSLLQTLKLLKSMEG